MRHQRQLEIVQRLRTGGATSVEELAQLLGVSSATIRRDLQQLDESGQITRVHGGAIVPAGDSEDADRDYPFASVAADATPEKRQVARLAATLVQDGDVVLIDVGTTTQLLAKELRGRPVTVMTTSLAVLDVLRDDPVVELILLGGWVRRAYHSLVGVVTEDALRQVHADIAFLGASGVQRDGYVLDTTTVEVPVKRAVIKASDKTVLLADRNKFPGNGKLKVCSADDIDVLVTNAGADPVTLQNCSDHGVEVLIT
ncbi:DeoR/GlpR family DNA-binding transcription regulator [Kribbella hippodromi]|uniref:DeoR/GlpR family DNA-binding transcription regulator n=1 Tax=Kribbella hippodromi TaxID=434347 RepID=A0ABP4N138_9ACTN